MSTAFNVKSSPLAETVIDVTNDSFSFGWATECSGGHRQQGWALCSVSVDRLDYDCLTGGVDVCVSSLMSAAAALRASRCHLCAPRGSKLGHTVVLRIQPTPSCFSHAVTSQMAKVQMRKSPALGCYAL